MTFCRVVALLAVVPFWTAHGVSLSSGARFPDSDGLGATDARTLRLPVLEAGKTGLSLGPEFPGAKGTLTFDGGVARIAYDFSSGGRYVGFCLPQPIDEGGCVLTAEFRGECPSDCTVLWRAVNWCSRWEAVHDAVHPLCCCYSRAQDNQVKGIGFDDECDFAGGAPVAERGVEA